MLLFINYDFFKLFENVILFIIVTIHISQEIVYKWLFNHFNEYILINSFAKLIINEWPNIYKKYYNHRFSKNVVYKIARYFDIF